MVKPPIAKRLEDADAEHVRRDTHRAIVEMLAQPAMAMQVVEGVALAELVVTTVRHSLGRSPKAVLLGVPRGAASFAGQIIEFIDSTVDRAQFIKLQASGWGATIHTDVVFL